MKRTLLATLAFLAILAPAAANAAVVSLFGVKLASCVVNSNGAGLTNGINVVYYNTHPSPATEVDFLVGYRGHRATLVDRGVFTRGSQINHNLANALVGRVWRGPNPNRCEVQRVILANGRVLQ